MIPNSKRKIRNCDGFTLIEVILIIIVFAIAIPPLVNLLSTTLEKSDNSAIMSRAVLYAQEKMEQIIADKRNPARGYDWVTAPGTYLSDVPSAGYARSVTITTAGNMYNGVAYAFLQVTLTHNNISDIKITTWLTNY